MPKGRWQASCPSCQQKFHHHRRPKNIRGRYCRKCGPQHGTLNYSCTS
jgi:hypothetical protein